MRKRSLSSAQNVWHEFCLLLDTGSQESGLGAVWILRLLKEWPNSYLLGTKLMYVRERGEGEEKRDRRRDKHVLVGSS